jgi:hypothetical protein
MIGVSDERFEHWWEKSKPYIADALEKSGETHSVEDVKDALQSNYAIFYPVRNGAAIFRVEHHPRRKLLNIWLAGGDMDANIDGILEAAEFHAKEFGCSGISVAGRKGWARVLKPRGYDYKRVVLIKDMN